MVRFWWEFVLDYLLLYRHHVLWAETIPGSTQAAGKKVIQMHFQYKTEMKVEVFSCIFYDVCLSQLLYLQRLRELIFHIGTEEGDGKGCILCPALASSGCSAVSQW